MIFVRIDADRVMYIGAGSPDATLRKRSPEVSMSPIKADARTDSEAGGFSISVSRVDSVESFFWPPPLGATLVAFDDRDGLEVARGTITAVEISGDVGIEVRL